jgi:hypothetical protein
MTDRLLCHIYHEFDGNCCGDGECVCLRPVPVIELEPVVEHVRSVSGFGYAILIAALMGFGLAVMTGPTRVETHFQIEARV